VQRLAVGDEMHNACVCEMNRAGSAVSDDYSARSAAGCAENGGKSSVHVPSAHLMLRTCLWEVAVSLVPHVVVFVEFALGKTDSSSPTPRRTGTCHSVVVVRSALCTAPSQPNNACPRRRQHRAELRSIRVSCCG
jgi:hypothetical protein